MTTGYKKGLWAEKLAELFLWCKGYRILARRFKTPFGEIDLVARRFNTLAFVEVKWRDTSTTAIEAIHSKNQNRVRQAAELYLQKHPACANLNIRFDALILAPRAWPQHMHGAWN